MIKITIEDLKEKQSDEYIIDNFLIISSTSKGLMKVSTNISNDELLKLLWGGIEGLIGNGLIPSFDN